MKVTVKLAHKLHSGLQLIVSFCEKGESEKAKKVALELAKLVTEQTVKTVDNCEECEHRRTTLETKREKK